MKPAPEYYSSPLSQYCAEHLPGDFHFLDGDEVLFSHHSQPIVYARESGVLRIIESKAPGEDIRRSQRETLPMLAGALDLAVESGLLATTSGVYVLEGEPPYSSGATVSKVRGATAPGDWSAVGIRYVVQRPLDESQVQMFLRCRPLLRGKAAA